MSELPIDPFERRLSYASPTTYFHDPIWNKPNSRSHFQTAEEHAHITMATKRLLKELDAYRRDPSSVVTLLEPQSDEDLFHLVAVLKGPEGTGYEGGHFHLSLTIPPTQYPNAPPEIRFRTPVCHPNVNFKTGEICLDLLKNAWTPAYGVVSALEAVEQLLRMGGEADSPLNLDLARLVREGDLVGAEGLVRFYTGRLAAGR